MLAIGLIIAVCVFIIMVVFAFAAGNREDDQWRLAMRKDGFKEHEIKKAMRLKRERKPQQLREHCYAVIRRRVQAELQDEVAREMKMTNWRDWTSIGTYVS